MPGPGDVSSHGWQVSDQGRTCGAVSTWRPRGLSKSVISRVISWVTPFRVLITLITYNPLTKSPGPPSNGLLGQQLGFRA